MDLNTIYNIPEDYDGMFHNSLQDVEFFRVLCAEYHGGYGIVEFGCGTLRLTIPLLKTGVLITAIDNNAGMLALGKKKLDWELSRYQFRAKVYEGDMRTFKVPNRENKYGLVISAGNSFLHLLSQADQVAALKNFWWHIPAGGMIMIDILNPTPERHMTNWTLDEIKSKTVVNGTEVINEETNERLVRALSAEYSKTNQHVLWNFFVQIYDLQTGELKREDIKTATLQLVFPNEWRWLLKLCGFTIVEEWGDYDKSAFTDDSPKMLFLAHKTHVPLV